MSQKYHAQPTVEGSKRFHSKREAARYRELCLLEKAGEISGLRCQVPYPLVVRGMKITTYRADFVYLLPDGCEVVEDVKGYETYEYGIKKKLVKALYGIDILETH